MTDDRRDERPVGGSRPDRGVAGDDEDLRAGFAALRAELEDSGGVPDFHAMLDRARAEVSAGASSAAPSSQTTTSEDARTGLVRLGRWIPLAAAAAVAGLFWMGGSGSGGDDDEFERLVADYALSASTWRSPTASLMEIPGVDLGSVPAIGTSFDATDLPDTEAPEGRDS